MGNLNKHPVTDSPKSFTPAPGEVHKFAKSKIGAKILRQVSKAARVSSWKRPRP